MMLMSVQEAWDEISKLYKGTRNEEKLANINIEMLTKFLSPFEKAIEGLEKDSEPTIQKVLLYLTSFKTYLVRCTENNEIEF